MLNTTGHKMSKEEELDFIDFLLQYDLEEIGRGGSRLVFQHPTNENLVVKVALGVGGIKQNRNETYTYIGYCDMTRLAEIYYFSDIFEVMEKVEPIDWECYRDDLEPEEADELDDEFNDIIYTLNDISGVTADNEQVGLTEDGHLAAYDYGFFVYENGVDDQTSSMSDYSINLYNYLLKLKEVVSGELTMMEVENDFLKGKGCRCLRYNDENSTYVYKDPDDEYEEEEEDIE